MSEEILEKKVQDLIYSFPWLLDINFELIGEIDKKGYEHTINNIRIDLLCRHRLSGRPVIIEFKRGGFYRENIGQILEYRTRVILELTNNYSGINEIFQNRLTSPILCLVVKECDDDSRIACNLNNIEVYEYKNYTNKLLDLNAKSLEEIQKNQKNNIIISLERGDLVNNFYSKLKDLLDKNNLTDEANWKNYKMSPGEYWYSYQHMFVNKWLFDIYDISIGIYENIINTEKNRFVFGLFRTNEDKINQFITSWNINYPDKIIESKIIVMNDEKYAEYYLDSNNENEVLLEYIQLIGNYMKLYKKEFV